MLTAWITREVESLTELGGSVAGMDEPDHYAETARRSRERVEEIGERPYTLAEIAVAFGVALNTVNSDWRGKRHTVKDPVKRFPLETWPGPAWAEGVLVEWAKATNRKFKPIRQRRSRARPADS